MEPSSCQFVSTSKSQCEATTRSLLSQMDSEQCQFIVALDPQPQTRCCSCCGQQGHNVRTCPQKTQQDTTTRNSPSSSRTRSEDHHNDHRSSSKWRRTSVDTPRYTRRSDLCRNSRQSQCRSMLVLNLQEVSCRSLMVLVEQEFYTKYWRCVDILHGEDAYQDQQSHSVSVKGHFRTRIQNRNVI